MSNHDAANQAPAGEPVNSDSDEKREAGKERERNWREQRHSGDSLWIKVGVPLLIGLAAAGAAYFGAQSGANATLEAQEQQLTAQQNQTVRTQREQVYEQYLKSADAYEVASSERYSQCAGDTTCPVNVAGWQSARFNYQGALNAVYVYGSNEAVRYTLLISAAMPPSLGIPSNYGNVAPGKVNEDLFVSAFQGFQRMMCLEVNPDPQDACSYP